MKNIYLFVIFSILLSSCTMSADGISDRKIKDLENRIAKLEANVLTIQFNDGKAPLKKEVNEAEKKSLEEASEELPEKVVIEEKPSVPDPKEFEVTEPKEGANLTSEPITFVGKIDKRATKITVKYVGVDGSDEYVLKNFKEGDTSFWYKASQAFDNLGKGKNTYEFIAEFNDGDKVALTPIVINYK